MICFKQGKQGEPGEIKFGFGLEKKVGGKVATLHFSTRKEFDTSLII
tara:strand:+ start:307 stop:447 length:141 start_codon:yes stop_codon:yes gene_type:complete